VRTRTHNHWKANPKSLTLIILGLWLPISLLWLWYILCKYMLSSSFLFWSSMLQWVIVCYEDLMFLEFEIKLFSKLKEHCLASWASKAYLGIYHLFATILYIFSTEPCCSRFNSQNQSEYNFYKFLNFNVNYLILNKLKK
jgi:hypothetical protein